MKNFAQGLIYWKLAILKVSGKALVALFASIVATLNGVEWTNFTGTQKFIAIGCGLTAMWTVIDAFLNDTMASLKSNRPDAPTDPDDLPYSPVKSAVVMLLATISLFTLTGCVADFGGRARTVTTSTNGVTRTEISVLRPAIAWGDARQTLASRRAANTKTGNSVGEKGVDQETSATNVAGIVTSIGGLIGEAAATYQKSIGLAPPR